MNYWHFYCCSCNSSLDFTSRIVCSMEPSRVSLELDLMYLPVAFLLQILQQLCLFHSIFVVAIISLLFRSP